MTKSRRILFALALTAALGGCMTQQTASSVSPGQALVRPSGPTTVNKSVLSGQSIEIGHVSAVNPDCTPAPLGTIVVNQPPAHGSAVLTQGEAFPFFPAGNPRSACNKTKSPSLILTYTPAPDFVGTDMMVIEVYDHNGGDSHPITEIITVK